MRRRDKYVIAKCVVRSLIYQFKIFILTAICFDVLGTRKCQNFKFLTKSRFTTNRTCYTLLNFRKNPTGGVSIEMAEPIRGLHMTNFSVLLLQNTKRFHLCHCLQIYVYLLRMQNSNCRRAVAVKGQKHAAIFCIGRW
jgi:hypothetical protein